MDTDCNLKKLYFYNRSLHEPWYFVFMALYSMITITSFLSNALLLIALHRFSKNRSRRQNRLSNQNLLIRPLKPVEITRDRLIFHLAVLDILLSFTMPLTALDALSKFWPFGKNTKLLCQATKSSPSIVVYSLAETKADTRDRLKEAEQKPPCGASEARRLQRARAALD